VENEKFYRPRTFSFWVELHSRGQPWGWGELGNLEYHTLGFLVKLVNTTVNDYIATLHLNSRLVLAFKEICNNRNIRATPVSTAAIHGRQRGEYMSAEARKVVDTTTQSKKDFAALVDQGVII
jgi:hypothetical protein